VTFCLTVLEQGSMDAVLLRVILEFPEDSPERHEALWFLYSLLAKKSAVKAEAIRREKRKGGT
jgi:hypothetical protein